MDISIPFFAGAQLHGGLGINRSTMPIADVTMVEEFLVEI